MNNYYPADKKNWNGRVSNEQLYLHEKVSFENLDNFKNDSEHQKIGLLGYTCDEGVRRNKGRIGASKGPEFIRKQLGKMPNHLSEKTNLIDFGDLVCSNENLDLIQEQVIASVEKLKNTNTFPILLGGGHDLAYAHYTGLSKTVAKGKTIGIINFDAHFDLRPNTISNNSGTPFFQIATNLKKEGRPFKYFCAGIRKDANDASLFRIAEEFGAEYLERDYFNMTYLEHVQLRLIQFLEDVDFVYTTIDIDGFSSAYAPGVSAASPMGFTPDIVLESLKLILDSGKLIGIDLVEFNPQFDQDDQTAKLTASLIHFIIHAL